MHPNIQSMLAQAKAALVNAYAPYSQFAVAACIFCRADEPEAPGSFFVGVNIENASYGLTQCAEACAIAQMVSAGQRRIDDILIIAKTDRLISPCGSCRQQIAEFAHKDTRIHLCQGEEVRTSCSIDELLPLTFNLHT